MTRIFISASWLLLFMSVGQGQQRNPFLPFDIARCTLRHDQGYRWLLNATLLSKGVSVAQLMTAEQQVIRIALDQFLPDSHLQVAAIEATQVRVIARAPCPEVSWIITMGLIDDQ